MSHSKKQITIGLVLLIGIVAVGIGIAGAYSMSGEKANLVLCLDDSGSMYSKQEERNQAAKNLVEQLNSQVYFGALYFQYNVTTASEIKKLQTPSARNDFYDMFLSESHEKDHGNTNAGAAMQEALSMIENARERQDEEIPSVILLFSDGENDFLDEDGEQIDTYVEEADQLTEEMAEQANNANVIIHTICLNDNDISLLEDVAEKTGGMYLRIDSVEELTDMLLLAADPYRKQKPQGGKLGMGILILLIIAGTGAVAAYYFRNYKKQEYLMDYQVNMMKDEIDQKNKREELDAQIREEQKNKKFYLDVIVTHGNAIGARSCFDAEGRRRGGIFSIGDVVMFGRNQRGEDYTYRIDEAGLEIWATFDEDELILRSKKTPFEIRKEGTARDQGNRTQKATVKKDQQYYIILNSKHEIGLLASRGI